MFVTSIQLNDLSIIKDKVSCHNPIYWHVHIIIKIITCPTMFFLSVLSSYDRPLHVWLLTSFHQVDMHNLLLFHPHCRVSFVKTLLLLFVHALHRATVPVIHFDVHVMKRRIYNGQLKF
jgi:hypothetical protein